MLIRVNELTLPLHFNYIIEMLYDAWENNFRQEPIHQLRDTEEGEAFVDAIGEGTLDCTPFLSQVPDEYRHRGQSL